MTEGAKPQKSRRLPWGRIVLFTSLAFNLLVVGLVAGALLRPDRFDGRPPLRDLGYGPFGAALSPEDRHELGRRLVDRAGDLRSNREELRRQFAEMLAALRAQPFDTSALTAVVEQQKGKLAERQEIGQALLMERITAMTDAERREFADRLERALTRAARERRR